MDLKATYDKIAKNWFNQHKASDWWSKPMLGFLSHLKAGQKILDVGCGAGLKAKYLTDRGFEVFGIDFSEEMIKLAQVESLFWVIFPAACCGSILGR